MALRIEAWLGVDRGGDARLWLAEQSAYNVWQAKLRFKAKPYMCNRHPWRRKHHATAQPRPLGHVAIDVLSAPHRTARLRTYLYNIENMY
jgi:hypothetical protein